MYNVTVKRYGKTKSLKEFYEDRFQEKGYNCRCVFIPNAIDYIPDTVSRLNNYNLVSVGRLSKEKGFLDLIEVFKKAYEQNFTFYFRGCNGSYKHLRLL